MKNAGQIQIHKIKDFGLKYCPSYLHQKLFMPYPEKTDYQKTLIYKIYIYYSEIYATLEKKNMYAKGSRFQ